MHCLLIGSTGMLGKRICSDARARGWKVTAAARKGEDISVDLFHPQELLKLKSLGKFDLVVNCAALTDIDECERNLPAANLVNAETPGQLANLAESLGAYFIHVSTDHFFSGDSQLRHWESDPVTIVNNYAQTKLLGERLALNYANALVVRTNIMGFRLNPQKDTFIEWVLKELLGRHDFFGFDDFYTSGMSVGALSSALCELAENSRPVGRWNIAGRDVFSKRDLIVRVGEAFGFRVDKVGHASVKNFTGVRRAESLALDSSKVENILGREMPSVEETISALLEEYRGSNEIQKFIQNS